MKKLLLLLLVTVGAGAPLRAQQTVRGLFRVTSLTATPPATNPNIITVTVTFATAPASPTATYAVLKHNLPTVFELEGDDNLTGIRDSYKLMNGGTASDGNTYPGMTFDDGTGMRSYFTGAVAVNARSNFNNGDLWGIPGKFGAAELATMVTAGWSLENHSYYHEPTGNFYLPATATASQAGEGLAQNQVFTYNKLLAQGVEFIMRIAVVPTNYPGFIRAADSLHYLAATSTQALDGYAGYPTYTALNRDNNGGNFAQEETLPLSATSAFGSVGFVQMTRNFTDNWGNLTTLKAQIRDMLDKRIDGQHRTMRLGTHTPTFAGQKALLTFIDSIGQGDKIWVTSLQQHLEYDEVKRVTKKSQVVAGNTLTITLDQSAVPPVNRWRDMTLLVAGGRISRVEVTGADRYSVNLNTGLINVYKQKTAGFPVPQ